MRDIISVLLLRKKVTCYKTVIREQFYRSFSLHLRCTFICAKRFMRKTSHKSTISRIGERLGTYRDIVRVAHVRMQL